MQKKIKKSRKRKKRKKEKNIYRKRKKRKTYGLPSRFILCLFYVLLVFD
jgi:hypothetical protein